jgi:hypothetical protein
MNLKKWTDDNIVLDDDGRFPRTQNFWTAFGNVGRKRHNSFHR